MHASTASLAPRRTECGLPESRRPAKSAPRSGSRKRLLLEGVEQSGQARFLVAQEVEQRAHGAVEAVCGPGLVLGGAARAGDGERRRVGVEERGHGRNPRRHGARTEALSYDAQEHLLLILL